MPTTINAVFCDGIIERDAAIALYKKPGIVVTWFGPVDVVSGEKITPPNSITQVCDAGPEGYLVVACPQGKGPFPA